MGTAPEQSLPSSFLKEVPQTLLEKVRAGGGVGSSGYSGVDLLAERSYVRETAQRNLYTGKTYNSVENIKQFFNDKGAQPPPFAANTGAANKTTANAVAVPAQPPMKKPAARKFGPGSTVEIAKYGRGTVVRIEGTGDDTKVTVSFPGHGLKKLIAKYAGIKIE